MKRQDYIADMKRSRKKRAKHLGVWEPEPKKVLSAMQARKVRHELRVSQETLASMMGTYRGKISRWEKEGVWAYTDREEGPVGIMYNLMSGKRNAHWKEIDKKDALSFLGYKGPEKNYRGKK